MAKKEKSENERPKSTQLERAEKLRDRAAENGEDTSEFDKRVAACEACEGAR